jgi:hypothetical protein
MMSFVTEAASTIGIAAAYNALGLPRATFYRCQGSANRFPACCGTSPWKHWFGSP